MVKSILNNKINYPENKKLDNDDLDYDASLYEISLLKENIIIALGQAKYTFIDENIIYYPIYLVKDDKVDTQIGLYEIISDNLPNIIDEDGDLLLDKIDEPLLYSFVDYKLLKNASTTFKEEDKDSKDNKDTVDSGDEESKDNEDSDSEDTKDNEDSDSEETKESRESKDSEESDSEDEETKESRESEDSNQDVIDENEFNIIIPEQNEEQNETEKKEYESKDGQDWIQKFIKSNHFLIIDSMIENNDDPGDCLFSVVCDALKGTKKEISVKDLRIKLSNSVTEEIFENYKKNYEMFKNSIKDNNQIMKKLNNNNNELRERLQNSKNREDQIKIVDEAKKISKEFQRLKNENKLSKDLQNEFNFMKNVNNLNDFKNIVKTCNFWADTWAISTLEKMLNIKLILFSKESFEAGDYNNVLQCGQLNDDLTLKNGEFVPDFYIMAEYDGSHYRLISYMHHKILSFNEIPYSVKLLITTKCMERNAGPYYIIPQFKKFYTSLGISEKEPIEEDSETENSLYTNNVVLQFYNKSNNNPLPGKGNGEKISNEEIKNYSDLSAFSEWRRKLSDDHVSIFTLDGHKWSSVEHYYQACKFKNTNREFFLQFSLDSNSNLSKDVELAKAAGSKTGKYKKDLVRDKDIKIDPEFYNNLSNKCLDEAIYAKFSQNNELKDILLATNNAKLLIYKKGSSPELANKLMMIRNKLIRETK